MKQRITYIVPESTGIDPASIDVAQDKVAFANAKDAAVEKRVTVGLSELPDELNNVLQDIHELHIRWSSRLNYQATSPLVSRLPPGLHVFFTPRGTAVEVNICPLLRLLFSPDLKCDSVSASFSSPPILSERFSHSSTYQYFHPLSRLLHFQTFLARTICGQFKGPCVNEAASLSYASGVDIDFDAISHAVTVTASWRAGIQNEASRTTPRKWSEVDSLEVGILHVEEADADEPEELKLGGYLTVVGEDEKPSGTLFSFPSRHHPLPPSTPATFRTSFQQPTGLHPKLDISFPASHLIPPKDSCALHAYLTLPSALFIDRYQLSDPLFLASQNLVALRSLSGEQDLEAPDWVVKLWGSAALVELAHPQDANASSKDDQWTVTVPTHLRYLQAQPNSTIPGQTSLDMPWPSVFWACEAQEGLKMATNPFDRVNLGYDGLFGPKTMLYHIPPAVEEGVQLVEKLSVPVLEPEEAGWVQMGTLAAVLVGFGWVLWMLFKPSGDDKGVSQERKKTE